MDQRYFTIADLAHFSCLKAHTLRMWEKRYALFNPRRGLGNVRHYSMEELDTLLKLTVLNQAGYKISRLIAMDSITMEKNLQQLSFEEDKRCREVGRLIISVLTLNTEEFEALLDKCVFTWGLDKTITLIIIPLMERMQLYSCKNCEIDVDFAVTAIRKKIFHAIEMANPLIDVERTALLFLPRGEHYDLFLLYYFYLLKSNGLKVLYMGTNISFEKVSYVVEMKRPDFLITYISPNQRRRVEEIKRFVATNLSQGTLVAAGFEDWSMEEEPGVNVKFMHYKHVTEFLLGA